MDWCGWSEDGKVIWFRILLGVESTYWGLDIGNEGKKRNQISQLGFCLEQLASWKAHLLRKDWGGEHQFIGKEIRSSILDMLMQDALSMWKWILTTSLFVVSANSRALWVVSIVLLCLLSCIVLHWGNNRKRKKKKKTTQHKTKQQQKNLFLFFNKYLF